MIGRRQILAAGAVLALPRVARAGDVADVSRWIAGTSASGASTDWDAYAQAETERWKAADARVKALRDFGDRELKPLLPADATLFYPFAGPDLLHAMTLFPTARRAVLVGLEPVGTLPAAGAAPSGYFTRLGGGMAELHRLGFFRTMDMASDFAKDGVLGVLVATIVRLGGTVERIQPQTGQGVPPSVRIDYRIGGDARRVDYVQADLSNAGLRAWPGVSALAPHVTFVKAAMYLLPEPRFSALRQLLLDGTSVLVQDDTGIPYRALGAEWAVRLFGTYEAPRRPFEDRLQPELRAAYATKSPRPLGFGLGYALEPKRSNLLVATKSG